MDQERRARRLVTNTLVLSIGTAFSSAFSFFMVPFYSRWLSVSEYGTYDLFVTYIALLQPAITLSCGEACFRFLLEEDAHKEKKSIISSSFAISMSGLIAGSGLLIIIFFTRGEIYVIPFICLLVSSTIFSQCGYIARGIRKLQVYTISNILYLVTMAVFVTIFVCFMKKGLTGILLGASIGYGAGCIYSFCTCKIWKSLKWRTINKYKIRKIVKYSIPLIPNTISWWIVGVSDRSLITIFLGSQANGIYAIATKIPSLCTTVFSVFHMSWQENATDALNDEDRNEYFNKVLNQVIPLCFCVCMIVLSTNRYMYEWIWDPQYIDGYYQVPILLTAAAISFLAQFIGGILVALKKTKINGISTVIAACINIILNCLLIKMMGLYAASLSTLVAYISLFLIRALLIKNDFTIKINKKSVISVLLYLIVILSQFSSNDMVGLSVVIYSIIISAMINRTSINILFRKILKK